jgi:hypothetical protein
MLFEQGENVSELVSTIARVITADELRAISEEALAQAEIETRAQLRQITRGVGAVVALLARLRPPAPPSARRRRRQVTQCRLNVNQRPKPPLYNTSPTQRIRREASGMRASGLARVRPFQNRLDQNILATNAWVSGPRYL